MRSLALLVSVFTSFLSTSLMAGPLKITGTAFRDEDTRLLSFDLRFGDESHAFLVKGNTSVITAFSEVLKPTVIDYSPIRVSKTVSNEEDGLTRTWTIENRGKLKMRPRERTLENMSLAGVALEGRFLQGFVDDSITFTNLRVDHEASRGRLDYQNLSGGHYVAQNGCSFGSNTIRSNRTANDWVMNHDNWYGQNAMSIAYNFGNLALVGRIIFSDRTRSIPVVTLDDDGNEHRSSYEVVDATTGHFDISVYKVDRTPFRWSDRAKKEAETDDEKALRRLIAFFQLTTLDTFAE